MRLYNIAHQKVKQLNDTAYAIGIDLGTTNSLVAFHNGTETRTIEVHRQCLIPSVVSYDGDIVTVGEDALTKPHCIRSVKRQIGHSNTIPTSNGSMTPEKISSDILKYLKRAAEQSLSCAIDKAVITVPAYFNEMQRSITKKAAELAGLQVLRLIAEPTAAALAYGMNKTGTYLVYDLGGGTFDVSILKFERGVFRVIATGGDSQLGGDDFDSALSKMLSMDLKIVRIIKEHLSQYESYQCDGISITRSQFEELIRHWVNKTIEIVETTIADANHVELDGIVLVGGSTRIPLIEQTLKSKFSNKILHDLDPDRIVAIGAAMQAYNLSTSSGNLLIDVVPLSLGIEVANGLSNVIVYRNSATPCFRSERFTTSENNQSSILIRVLQGEYEMAHKNKSISEFKLSNIPPMPAGMPEIEVKFNVDMDGILTVSAKEKISDVTQEIEVNPIYDLTEVALDDIMTHSIAEMEEDFQQRCLMDARDSAKILIHDLSEIHNIPKKIQSMMQALNALIQNSNATKITDMTHALREASSDLMCDFVNRRVQSELIGRNISKLVGLVDG